MKSLFPLLLFVAVARAQLSQADPSVQQACRQAEAVGLPSDMAGLPVPKAYPICESYKLYDSKKFAEARACAAQERMALLARVPASSSAAPKNDTDEPVPAGGLVVLSELYANGEGVPRDGALAGRFFCEGVDTGEIDNERSETKNILAMLKRLEEVEPSSAHVEYCNAKDPMTRLPDTPLTRKCSEDPEEAAAEMHEAGVQGGIDAAQQDADEADKAIAPMLAQLTPAQSSEYLKVAEALKRFIDAQATGDLLYMGGYRSGGLYPNEIHAAFENQVVEFAKKSPPTPEPQEFAMADKALNLVYRQLIAAAAAAGDFVGRPLSETKLRAEQRAWVAYRDAFVAFGRSWRPALPAEAWMLPLTRKRTEDLTEVDQSYGDELVEQGQKHQAWIEQVSTKSAEDAASARGQVSEYFDHQNAAQAASWKRVEDAVRWFAEAHRRAASREEPGYEDKVLQSLYGELYVMRYNKQHGFGIDEAKAKAAAVTNEARLKTKYQDALACQKRTEIPEQMFRSVDGLREEQRTWLKLRNAWSDFLGTLFPGMSPEARSNLFTGGRAFELEMDANRCVNVPPVP